jgi:hypothetical protein
MGIRGGDKQGSASLAHQAGVRDLLVISRVCIVQLPDVPMYSWDDDTISRCLGFYRIHGPLDFIY